MKKLLVSMAILTLLAGCASQQAKEQAGAKVEEPKPAMTGVKPKADAGAVTKPVTQKPIVANPLKDPGNILSKRSVYYDFDSAVIKDEFKPLVTAHSRYLSQNRSTKMTIQGNTDERGSREYNIALGQRRADSVKQMMILLGAQDAQIETVSFGEEKPHAQGHDETAWSENRRSDIVYQGE